jgi:DNA-binding beta-propeller fold protein YncE
MESRRFETFTRILADSHPRRWIVGSLLSAISTTLVAPGIALACKKVGKKCDKNNDCCDGARCKGGKNGKCRCKSGFSKCGNTCFDLDKDEKRCGSCNTTCASAATCQNGVCAEGGYTFVGQFGESGFDDGEFFLPTTIAISAGVQVYVADTGNRRIEAFTRDGDFLGGWEIPDVAFSYIGVALAADGSVYVTDASPQVQKFDGAGIFQLAFGSQGSGPGEFNEPKGIAVHGNGDVSVVDSDNSRIQTFEADGTLPRASGSPGSGEGQFARPEGIAITTNDEVFIADFANHRIQKFAANGDFLTSWGSEGSGDGQFLGPRAIAVGPDDSVFVLDTGTHRVQKFDSEGAFLGKWGRLGDGEGEFDTPQGVAVDDAGIVYVVDSFNNRIQKFAPI